MQLDESHVAVPLAKSVDAIRESVNRLGGFLPGEGDTSRLMDFLRDDLLEGLDAVADVEMHFTGMIELLQSERASPVAMLNASDDFRVSKRLDELSVIVERLRRRVAQAAGVLRRES